jgi:hypothetical protein
VQVGPENSLHFSVPESANDLRASSGDGAGVGQTYGQIRGVHEIFTRRSPEVSPSSF